MTAQSIESPEMSPEEALKAAQACIGELLALQAPDVPVEFEQGWRSQPIRPEQAPRHVVRIAAVAPWHPNPEFPKHRQIRVVAHVATYVLNGQDAPSMRFGRGDQHYRGRTFVEAQGDNVEHSIRSNSNDDLSIAGNGKPMPRGGDLPYGLRVEVETITVNCTLNNGGDSDHDEKQSHQKTAAQRAGERADAKQNAINYGLADPKPTQVGPWGV